MLLALYVAWPAEERTGRALRRALEHALADVPGGLGSRRLTSVLVDAADAPPAGAVQTLLADAAARFGLAPDLEATLAIDPRAAPDLTAYRAAGINRLALRAGVLEETAQNVLSTGRRLFPRCAVDLAFGRPGQSLAGWRAELDRALELGAGHLSLEEHPSVDAADDDLAAALYRAAIDHLGAAGLPPYEIAHFARPGDPSRQLLHGATGGDYLGIGPGAVSRITTDGVCHALARVETEAGSTWQELSRDERRTELLLSGLRLRAGVGRAWFEPLAGPLEAALEEGQLALLIEDRFVELDQEGLRLTERGWPLCDAVLARLLK